MSKERIVGDYARVPVTDDYDAVIIMSPTEAHLSTRAWSKVEKIIGSFSVAYSTKHPIRKVGYMHDWLNGWRDGILSELGKEYSADEMMLFFVYKP